MLQNILLVLCSLLYFQYSVRGALLCSTLNPRCGLSPSEAQLKFLTPHTELIAAINRIQAESDVPIRVGPLIKNGKNRGIIDIDTPLNLSLAPLINTAVCGDTNITPTIRDAIICSVTQDKVAQPPRGNVEPEKIGYSTHGRVLYAVRLGNPSGKKVFVVTQQHGNECGSTEGALKFLRTITKDTFLSRRLLQKLDLLILMRANPDGSEPSANNFPELSVLFNDTEGFFRQNVDLSAGGGFKSPAEPNFAGVVGRGYDLNGYNFAALTSAIRPPESQAIVSVLFAFKPDFVYDAHGDLPKVSCELDPATFVPDAVLGVLPTVECKRPSLPVPTVLSQRRSSVLGGFFAVDPSVLTAKNSETLKNFPFFGQKTRLVRSIIAEVINRIDPSVEGVFTRYNEVTADASSPTGTVSGALSVAATMLGAVGSGWETANFAPPLRQAVVTTEVVKGEIIPTFGVDNHFIEPCFLQDNICLQELILEEVLVATAKFADERVVGDNGYCAIPLDNGLVGSFPASLGWGEDAIEETIMVPSGGEFGVPTVIAGRCAGDPE